MMIHVDFSRDAAMQGQGKFRTDLNWNNLNLKPQNLANHMHIKL